MSRRSIRATFFLLIAVSVCVANDASAAELNLRVMTFNIKYGSPSGDNNWPDRRPVLKRCIEAHDPDLIGTQEGLFFQIKDMAEDLPAYDWVGLGRGGGSKDEFMAIFYKSDRFEVMAYDHFWLSDTPEIIGSRTWGHDNRRMVTWVRFKDRATGTEFDHWNTHFDHRVQDARVKSAELMIRRIRAIEPALPVVVTGDFNAAPDNVVHGILNAAANGERSLRDMWETASERVGERVGTSHGWRGTDAPGRRIDWILATREFSCRAIRVDTYSENGQYPSDHFPVVADLLLTRP